jgi:hypothetical protein
MFHHREQRRTGEPARSAEHIARWNHRLREAIMVFHLKVEATEFAPMREFL